MTEVTEEKSILYDKISDYVESLFNVYNLIRKQSDKQQDKRLKLISFVILNYIKKMAIENNIDLLSFKEPETINLIPVFEYITYNNIQLYNFENINITDVDTSNNADIERYVLTHVYYITQQKNNIMIKIV